MNGLRARAFLLLRKPQGRLGVWLGGHREYVGGLWEEIGKLQFDFMLRMGLRPEHVLLDIACGSLRGGRHFIPYLDRGNYLGIEKEASLLRAGIRQELGRKLLTQRAPEFVISDSFEFHKFSKRPDFALAQSLFTHLAPGDIQACLTRLRANVNPGARLYATFRIRDDPAPATAQSHAHRGFDYSQAMAEEFGRKAGWAARYIGDWGHPRGQQMLEYVAQ